MNERWRELATSHTRCSQIYILLHHALLIPSILMLPAVSLFEASSIMLKYAIVGAAAATALSLGMKLELRAYIHRRAAKEYLLIYVDAQHGGEDLRNRITQLLREAPLLPCICTPDPPRENVTTGVQGPARDSHV